MDASLRWHDGGVAVTRPTMSAVPSPCTGVCTLDDAQDLCVGCGRTLDEIAAWSTMTDDARRAVWMRLKRDFLATVRHQSAH